MLTKENQFLIFITNLFSIFAFNPFLIHHFSHTKNIFCYLHTYRNSIIQIIYYCNSVNFCFLSLVEVTMKEKKKERKKKQKMEKVIQRKKKRRMIKSPLLSNTYFIFGIKKHMEGGLIVPNKGKIISENTVWDHLISLLSIFLFFNCYSMCAVLFSSLTCYKYDIEALHGY